MLIFLVNRVFLYYAKTSSKDGTREIPVRQRTITWKYCSSGNDDINNDKNKDGDDNGGNYYYGELDNDDSDDDHTSVTYFHDVGGVGDVDDVDDVGDVDDVDDVDDVGDVGDMLAMLAVLAIKVLGIIITIPFHEKDSINWSRGYTGTILHVFQLKTSKLKQSLISTYTIKHMSRNVVYIASKKTKSTFLLIFQFQ